MTFKKGNSSSTKYHYNSNCKGNEELGRAIFGVLVLLGGTALLLRSLDIYRDFIDSYIFEWQVILVLLGITSIATHVNKGPGLIMLCIGVVFYLRDYYDFTLNIVFWQVMIAIVMLMIGFAILFMKKSQRRKERTSGSLEGDPDTIEDIAIMGGTERSVITDNFKGGKIIAFLGGSVFNLKGCSLAQGRNYLDVLCVFGGFKLVIPKDWNIKIQTVSVFGGLSDKRKISDQDKVIHTNELVIKGLVLFGGGEIKR